MSSKPQLLHTNIIMFILYILSMHLWGGFCIRSLPTVREDVCSNAMIFCLLEVFYFTSTNSV